MGQTPPASLNPNPNPMVCLILSLLNTIISSPVGYFADPPAGDQGEHNWSLILLIHLLWSKHVAHLLHTPDNDVGLGETVPVGGPRLYSNSESQVGRLSHHDVGRGVSHHHRPTRIHTQLLTDLEDIVGIRL